MLKDFISKEALDILGIEIEEPEPPTSMRLASDFYGAKPIEQIATETKAFMLFDLGYRSYLDESELEYFSKHGSLEYCRETYDTELNYMRKLLLRNYVLYKCKNEFEQIINREVDLAIQGFGGFSV